MNPSTELLRHADDGTPWPDALRAVLPAGLDGAYALALDVRAQRVARGERPAGYKVGFTNRTIWSRYRVFAPIWGSVWDTTVHHVGDGDGPVRVSLDGLCEPRLEPEIVFALAATPPPQATVAELFAALDWLAPGFEIVQTHCPNWVFDAAETVADGGLHGRLVVGRRLPLRTLAADAAALHERLAAMQVELRRDGAAVEHGRGANVLDSPLHALRHFVDELHRCPGAPRLQAGDVVTTGTWTDAWPLERGQRWQAVFDDPVGTLELQVE